MAEMTRLSIDDALEERVRAAAEQQHMSAAEWLRQAVERALGDAPQAADPLARLASIEAPTADIEEMLAQIDAGRA